MVLQSVVSVCPLVRVFVSILKNQLTFDFDCWHYVVVIDVNKRCEKIKERQKTSESGKIKKTIRNVIKTFIICQCKIVQLFAYCITVRVTCKLIIILQYCIGHLF